jgi:glucose dehydrogenase
VLYVSTAWSKVKAFDAATGAPLWSYDPEVPGDWAVNACCDVVNRGVAVWNGKVFVGSLDGRLIALDAASGRALWDVNTIDRSKPYTITGAPRVVKGKVLIGNGGAEFGVRGYVSAYDAETGQLAWRFYTVPGNPADGFEHPILKMAATTDRPGTTSSAARARATTSSSPPSSRSIRTTGRTCGTTRRRPARRGTTRPRSTSSSPTCA